MSDPTPTRPFSLAEAATLFADLKDKSGLVLGVSGGPDSTALLFLIARWRARLKRGPKLLAVTVDHGLRRGSRREATAVKRLAAALGVPHRTVRWTGAKPRTGIQELAREMRYRLLADAARKAGAQSILTAHTLDDQAETVLFRLARGSGLRGLGGMAWSSPLPTSGKRELLLVRPLLSVPKARLIATLRAARITFVEDPTNQDPRFTRPRLRRLMPVLAAEGLDAGRLALLAARARRANAAIDWTVCGLAARFLPGRRDSGAIVLPIRDFRHWPAEVALRLLKKAIELTGGEGPAELGKLEALFAALHGGGASRFRRTLAGSMVTLMAGDLKIERAPPRRVSMPGRRKAAELDRSR
jgi:tRNA(Ile)-lysidine synthase